MYGPNSEETPKRWFEKYTDTGFYPPVTYLLIDDLHIAHKEGVCRIPCRLKKKDEPVLVPEKPWEGDYVWFHNSFLYDHDEKVFKLWYHCHDPGFNKAYPNLKWECRRAYAVSSDCEKWERPELGVFEWNGSKRNNLILMPVPTGGDGSTSNVFKDYRDPDPDRRYKAMGMERHLRQPDEKYVSWPGGPKDEETPIMRGLYMHDSKDGFLWRRRPRMLMSNALSMDGTYIHGFDEDMNAWIIWQRIRTNPKFRTIGVSITRDLEKIPFPQMVLALDEEDPPGTEFDRFSTIKVPGGYVGLLRFWYPGETNRTGTSQLAFSRDTKVWERPAGRRPILNCGEKGSWDEMIVVAGNPVEVGDDIYILYTGRSLSGKQLKRIGLAKLKRDRWAAIEPVYGRGVLQTRPMYWADRSLKINADAEGGFIRAELLDIWGKRIPGFAISDSDPFSGDSLEHMMSWNGKRELPLELAGTAYMEGNQDGSGRAMSIRFFLERAKLFSFSC